MRVERLLVGVARVDITPIAPIPLAGFAARDNAPFEAIDHPLALKAFWWSVGDKHALLVVADILWWAPERVDGLRARIADRWPVTPDRIILHATHTHSAPQASRIFTPSLGLADDSWVALLERRLLDAVGGAWERRLPARVRRGRGASSIGINRRVVLGVEPASSGKIDPEVVVLRIDGPRGQPIAALVHYACHPTVNERAHVSPDFPGVMCDHISRELGAGAVVAFLQGCCGDINPLPFLQRDERMTDDADVLAIAAILAADIEEVLNGPMDDLEVGFIAGHRTEASLEMQRVPTAPELDDAARQPGLDGEWARALLAYPARCISPVGVDITHLRLGDELSLLAMAAEVTTPYGLAIKSATHGATLPLPYSNGMSGYVVTDDQLVQGGYEPVGSVPCFALPSPFAPGIERAFTRAITRTLHPEERSATAP